MEWNLKSPSWDLTQFGQEPNSDNNLVDESRSSMVDLKLGRVTNCSDESKGKSKELGFGTKVACSSPSGSSKRGRGGGNNASAQMVSCLVDGCVSDLKNCREYHRRHKVCELHSKTPQVTIGGHKQRFCQQCSRFHSLGEFDEGKRSCRKRLDGHNRRRRKPQPEPMLPSNSYLSNYPGTRLFSFSPPSNLMANPTWPRPIKTMEEASLYNNNKGMNQFPLMHGENPMFNNNNIASSQTCGSSTSSSNHRMFTTRGPDSDCALSLLSSPPPPPMQPLVPNQLRYNGIELVDSMILAGNPNAHCHGFFHMNQNDESCSHSDAPQTLPFSWD